MASPGSSPLRRPLYSSLPTGDDSSDDGEEGIKQEPDDRRQPQQPQCFPFPRGGLTASPPTTPSRTGVRSSPVRTSRAAAALGEVDSPSWRARVRSSVAETKERCGGFKELVKGAKELGKATTALAAASRAAAKANAKASARLPVDEGGVVKPLLQRFGATLQEMAMAQDTLAQSLHEAMVVPLEGFVAEAADRCVELERAYERERGEFVEALGKLLRTQIKPTGAGGANGMGGGSSAAVSPLSSAAASAGALRGMGGGGPIGAGGVLVHRARDLGRSRRQFEQARLRLAQKVEEVEARRTLEVTESVAAVLQHLEDHHRLCLDVLAGLGPSLERLREAQAWARDGLGRGKEQWERKAEMLEMLLPADLAERLLDPLEEARLARILGGAGLAPGETPTAAFTLLDKKLGVLGANARSSLLFHPRSPSGVHYESWLWMRVASKGLGGGASWLRRWFVLEGSRLFFVRESGGDPGEPWVAVQEEDDMGGLQRTLVCDVLLSSVREVTGAGGNGAAGVAAAAASANASVAASAMAAVVASGGGGADPGSLPFCFEIFSANRTSVLVQAEDVEDFQGWTAAIRKRIERLLIGEEGQPHLSPQASSSSTSPARVRSASPSPPPSPPKSGGLLKAGGGSSGSFDSQASSSSCGSGSAGHHPLVAEILAANPSCADCGASNPDWCSLNLGVVVCIQCSGIHRSLGVHLSKIRSLTLDAIDPAELALLKALGNARANACFEHALLDGWRKPGPDEERATREKFIMAKYQWKGFTAVQSDEALGIATVTSPTAAVGDGSSLIPPAEAMKRRMVRYSQRLIAAAAAGDVEGALRCVAAGADLDWRDPDQGHRTALHVAAAGNRAEVVALLVQNGARADVRDADGLVALDLATAAAGLEAVRYLLRF